MTNQTDTPATNRYPEPMVIQANCEVNAVDLQTEGRVEPAGTCSFAPCADVPEGQQSLHDIKNQQRIHVLVADGDRYLPAGSPVHALANGDATALTFDSVAPATQVAHDPTAPIYKKEDWIADAPDRSLPVGEDWKPKVGLDVACADAKEAQVAARGQTKVVQHVDDSGYVAKPDGEGKRRRKRGGRGGRNKNRDRQIEPHANPEKAAPAAQPAKPKTAPAAGKGGSHRRANANPAMSDALTKAYVKAGVTVRSSLLTKEEHDNLVAAAKAKDPALVCHDRLLAKYVPASNVIQRQSGAARTHLLPASKPKNQHRTLDTAEFFAFLVAELEDGKIVYKVAGKYPNGGTPSVLMRCFAKGSRAALENAEQFILRMASNGRSAFLLPLDDFTA